MMDGTLGSTACAPPSRYVPSSIELAQQAERDVAYARQNALSIAIADNGGPTNVIERARAYADFLING